MTEAAPIEHDKAAGEPVGADVITFVDEAGLGGLVRNLTSAKDEEIGLMCALPIPLEHVDYARDRVRPFYDAFCSAAPTGAKLHITDAFAPGNNGWRTAAEAARDGIFALMEEIQLRVVYAARRGRIAREQYELLAQVKADAQAGRKARPPSKFAVPGRNRPSDEIVLDQVMTDLSLLIDAFMETAERQLSDFHFDQIDRSLAERYTRMIERTCNISFRRHEVKARNLATGQDEVRAIEMRAHADFPLDAIRVGRIIVAGKTDPLVFAVDVVANSLWRHLRTLPNAAPLNEASSLAGWSLEPVTTYDRRPDAPPSPLDLI